MKTAEEYWNQYMAPAGLARFGDLSFDSRRHAAREMVAAIRADALAEKTAPDADEQRAKRELARLDEFCRKHGMSGAPWGEQFRNGFSDYVKTLPRRPVRSPAQRMRDVDIKHGLSSSDLPLESLPKEHQQGYEAAAAELGIKPQE